MWSNYNVEFVQVKSIQKEKNAIFKVLEKYKRQKENHVGKKMLSIWKGKITRAGIVKIKLSLFYLNLFKDNGLIKAIAAE